MSNAPISSQENSANMSPIPKLAWGGAGSIPSVSKDDSLQSFKDLMSEDLAKNMQEREQDDVFQQIENEKISNSSLLDTDLNDDTTNSDLLLAHMLQEEFNKEYNSQILREEKHFNKNSKLIVSFNKYKLNGDSGSSSVEDLPDIDDEDRDIDSFEERERNDPVIPPCGYIRLNNEIITKHDININGRRNAQRVMNFPPGINTGDGGGFPMEISNQVYNRLNQSANSDSKRKLRIKDKSDNAITNKAFDKNTKMIVYKMVNNAVLENVSGVISTGKESIIFHARGGTKMDETTLPDNCAIKVFKTTLTDFKTRERYIKDDFRFKDRFCKNNNKMMVQLWAEKEFHNLKRLQKAGIPSPRPILIKNHVLVMSLIGDGEKAASKLKDVRLPLADWCRAYEQVVEIMMKMFQACKLVHGDMSEYNILWHDDQCWVIDVSQSVEPRHPDALKYLLRDCSNITGFFQKKGVTDISSPMELLKKITGIELLHSGENDENIIEEYEINKDMWKEGLKQNNDCFEYLWTEIQKEESLFIPQTESEFIPQTESEDDNEEVQKVPNHYTQEKRSKKKKRRSKKKNKTLVVSTDGDLLSEEEADQFRMVNTCS